MDTLKLARDISIYVVHNHTLTEDNFLERTKTYVKRVNIKAKKLHLQKFVDADDPEATPIGRLLLRGFRSKRLKPTLINMWLVQ